MDITYFPFKLLSLAGQNIFGNRLIFTIFGSTVITSCFVLGLLEPIFNYKGLETWAGALEVGGPSWQWITKMLIYKVHKKLFRRLIQDFDKFWSIDSQGPEIEKTLTSMYTVITKSFKIFFGCSAVASTLMSIRPILTFRRQLPILAYNVIDFNQTPVYEIVYFWHCVYSYFITTFIVGFDGLFFVLCTCAVGQLTLLKHALRNLKGPMVQNDEICRRYIKRYVRHHDLILQYLKDIKAIFSLLLLNQFLSSVMCLCMAIYLIYNEGFSDLIFVARCGLFALAGVLQIFIYCLIGTLIKAETDSVQDAIYESDWWRDDTMQLKKAVLFIIQRSQTSKHFSAGGMVDLDLQSFTKILRMSFSFFTLMQSTSKKVSP